MVSAENHSAALAGKHVVSPRSRSTRLAFWMASNPLVDPGSSPDPACGQRHLWCREVLVLPCDLVGALTGDAEHLGDLRHTDEVMAHARSLPETLDRRYSSLVLLR